MLKFLRKKTLLKNLTGEKYQVCYKETFKFGMCQYQSNAIREGTPNS